MVHPYDASLYYVTLVVVWSNEYILDGEEKTYGGCEGPDAMYVKLISSDGHEFIVKREHALTSGTIKAMLSGPGEYLLPMKWIKFELNFFFSPILLKFDVLHASLYRSVSVFMFYFIEVMVTLHYLCFSGQFAENETNEVNFREIPSHVLSKVCMYFTYKVRYTNSSTEIPEFPIAPEIALELLMAANFLDC